MSVRHKVGGRYVRRGQAASMFGELQGRSSDVAEWLDPGLEGFEKLFDVKATSVYVRSVSGRPDTMMDLCER